MSRITTAYYGADVTTQFAWATTDADKFDRELDLYRLAQAVENHDHSNTRGLAVARIVSNGILEPMYQALTVSTRALADVSVTTAKLADGSVTDAKMANQKVNRVGDVISGAIRISHSATPTVGVLYLGNDGSLLQNDGANLALSHASGGRIYQFGESWIVRGGANQTGFSFYGLAGHYVGFDGVNLVADGQTIRTALNTVDAPLGAIVAFRTLAELTAAGARWARETNADGRLLVGAGTTSGGSQSFLENTLYNTSWAPLTSMGYAVTVGTLAVSGGGGGNTDVADATHVFTAAAASSNNGAGATVVSTSGHTHPLLGGGAALTGAPGQTNAGATYLPPALGVIWGRRIS